MKTSLKTFHACLLALGVSFMALPALADTLYWTNWTSQVAGNPGGSASGTITIGSDIINVTYSGEVASVSDQGNWSQGVNSGGVSSYTNPGTGLGTVDNAPLPSTVSVPLTGGNRTIDTIYFSSPVLDPVMAIQSLGQPGLTISYDFINAPFTLLDSGSGHWGGSSSGSMTQSGDNLFGTEGNGIIQFDGVYSSISWTVPNAEYYHMFTVGAPDAASSVPEPATMLLFGIGLASLAGVIKSRKA